jgi:hypothetical protein
MLLVSERAIMKAAVVAGSNKAITMDDNANLANGDLLIFGEPIMAKTEIAKINAAVTPGTAIQVDSLTFPHAIGTPLYKIPYDQVKFYHADTLAGDKTLIGSAVDIDVEDEYTVVVDSTNSTGYLFFQLFNSATSAYSDYSAGFSYGTIPYGSRIKIREFVTSPHNWNKALDEDTFNALCDFAESEIFAIKRWRFREKIVSFNSVADQQAYTKTEAGVTDLGQLLYATYDGNPVFPVSLKVHRRLNWNSIQSGIPRTICEFDDSLEFTPIPPEVKAIKLYYYRNSAGFANETIETEVKLPQAIGFRVLMDLWATADMRKAKYFENRYLQTVAAMKLDDLKQVSKLPALSDVGMDNDSFLDQVDRPNRIT